MYITTVHNTWTQLPKQLITTIEIKIFYPANFDDRNEISVQYWHRYIAFYTNFEIYVSIFQKKVVWWWLLKSRNMLLEIIDLLKTAVFDGVIISFADYLRFTRSLSLPKLPGKLSMHISAQFRLRFAHHKMPHLSACVPNTVPPSVKWPKCSPLSGCTIYTKNRYFFLMLTEFSQLRTLHRTILMWRINWQVREGITAACSPKYWRERTVRSTQQKWGTYAYQINLAHRNTSLRWQHQHTQRSATLQASWTHTHTCSHVTAILTTAARNRQVKATTPPPSQ